MRLVWMDLETTGLNERKNQILEIGILITDEEGKPIAVPAWAGTGMRVCDGVISSPVKMICHEELDPFIQKMHTDNGLLAELDTGAGDYPHTLESRIAALIEELCPNKDDTFLAGNSLSLDQRFMRRFMPSILQRMHYRLFDMSSVAEFFRTLGQARPSGDPGMRPHRVTEDILHSRELFNHYRHLALHGVHYCNPQGPQQDSAFRSES